MSIVIKGLHNLIAASYKQIIIEEKENNYSVQIKGDGLGFHLSVSPKINSTLRKYSEEERINYVLDEFLQSETIAYIQDGVTPQNHTGEYSCIGTSTEKELYIRVFDRNKKIKLKKIFDKYDSDRQAFCEKNSDIDFIELNTTRWASYSVLNGYIQFNLLSNKNGVIVPFEKKFLNDYLYKRFSEEGEVAVIENKNVDTFGNDEYSDLPYINLGYYVTCGNLVISLDGPMLLPEITEIVSKYNSERMVKVMNKRVEGQRTWKSSQWTN